MPGDAMKTLEELMKIIEPVIRGSIENFDANVSLYWSPVVEQDSTQNPVSVFSLVVEVNNVGMGSFGNLFTNKDVTTEWMRVSFTAYATKTCLLNRVENSPRGNLCFSSGDYCRPYLAFTGKGVVPVVFVHKPSLGTLFLPGIWCLDEMWVSPAVKKKFLPRVDIFSLVTVFSGVEGVLADYTKTAPSARVGRLPPRPIKEKRKLVEQPTEEKLVEQPIEEKLYDSFKRWKGPFGMPVFIRISE